MLENSLIESGERARTRKPTTVLASAVLHTVLVVALVLLPLLQPQAIPLLSTAYGLPLPPALKPDVPIELVAAPPHIQLQIQPDSADLIAPTVIPRDIAFVVDAPAADSQLPSGMVTGIRSVLGPMVAQPVTEALPPPPEPPPPPISTAPVRVGGGVELANLIFQAKPTYPPIARQARVQGAVVLEATISKDGSVVDLRVISGNPLLNEAAIDAVRQWRYKPTLLNGDPVAVITTITVNFALQ
jgi:periplasmic protein TonB